MLRLFTIDESHSWMSLRTIVIEVEMMNNIMKKKTAPIP
jgi:hypothetical protein